MFGNIHTKFALHRRAVPGSGPAAADVTHSIPLRSLWWAAFLLLSLAASAVGWTIWQLRIDGIRSALLETGNIATVLGGQLSRSLQAIDTELLELKRSAKAQGVGTGAGLLTALDIRSFHDSLMEHLARLPQAFNIAV